MFLFICSRHISLCLLYQRIRHIWETLHYVNSLLTDLQAEFFRTKLCRFNYQFGNVIITVRKRICGKVMFYTCLSVCHFCEKNYVWLYCNRQFLAVVGESICKYETRVACGQDGLHSCGELAHEEFALCLLKTR